MAERLNIWSLLHSFALTQANLSSNSCNNNRQQQPKLHSRFEQHKVAQIQRVLLLHSLHREPFAHDSMVSFAPENIGMDLLELNKQTGKFGQWIFKVVRTQIISYSYKWMAKDVNTKKLQVVLLSADENKYCVGVLKAQKNDYQELEKVSNGIWKMGSVVRATRINFLSDKPNYIHTPVKIVIDLRQTTFTVLLAVPLGFAAAASPPAPVADVVQFQLEKKERRLFDVLGYATVSEVR
jgi:hypothetical protein